jgi:transmembrane sensor
MSRDHKLTSLDAIETTAARWIARRDAGLSPESERELAAWLAEDPRHREALAFHEATWNALARPAAGDRSDVMQSHLRTLAARRRSRRTAVAVTSLAAAAALAIFIHRPSTSIGLPRATSPVAQVIVPARQTLPDGSTAELKDDARLTLDFTTSARRITLHAGEAHFTVQPDPSRPFIVSAASFEVRAVGTAFSVRHDSAAVEVLVTHGTVALEQDSSSAATRAAPVAPLATLNAGSSARIEHTDSAQPQIRTVAPEELTQRLAWRGPRLELARIPLAEATELFNRHAPAGTARLVVGDAKVGALRVSGVFRADNAAAFVTLLETAFDVKVERSPDTIVLRAAP